MLWYKRFRNPSVAHEYGVKYEELLTTRAFCEELIKEIIGNIYISNSNKK